MHSALLSNKCMPNWQYSGTTALYVKSDKNMQSKCKVNAKKIT